MKKSIEFENLKTGDNNLNESIDALSDFDYKIDKGITYDVKKSSASCLVEDVIGISFGAFTSRFWALRKHINCLHDTQVDKIRFYAWQCISLTLKHREVDLVFKNEK